MKNFRGEELYIYPPDTFRKPILILSKTRDEFAIMFQQSLNHFTLLENGLRNSWTIIEKGNNVRFNMWKKKLQSTKSYEFYLEIYDKYWKRENESRI